MIRKNVRFISVLTPRKGIGRLEYRDDGRVPPLREPPARTRVLQQRQLGAVERRRIRMRRKASIRAAGRLAGGMS